jgi:chemosensory pili system protein ChpB (putative protein-glutamate methylesterase)
MSEGGNPRIGIIADSTLQGHLLSQAVRGQGFDLVVNTDPENLQREWFGPDRLDLWIVDLTSEDRWQDFLDVLLEDASAPILFCDGQAPARNASEYPRWERRLLGKMLDYVERPRIEERLESLEPVKPKITIPTPTEFQHYTPTTGGGPERVWVLGASLGGPAAVKLFLDALPAQLPVAFVLAQHIDDGFLETLTRVLVRDNGFRCRIGVDGERLENGTVLIAPVEYEISFAANGGLASTGREWEGPYAPSIDQVMQNASDCFGPRASAIIFSGMGNDGSIAGTQMKSKGGQVWAQSAESCAVSSQPDAVRETGCVGYSGTPEQLAAQLVENVRQELREGAARA